MNETGAETADDRPSEDLKTTRLYCRAIRGRWAVPAAIRGRVISELCGTIDPPADGRTTSAREKVTAAKALLAADRANQEANRTDLARE